MAEYFQLFNSDEFGQLPIAEVGGRAFFRASSVAEMLGYKSPAKAVIDHCKGVTKLETPTNGGIQLVKYIPEGDVYRLIVKAADQSKSESVKERAQRFESWIFDKVLPSIHKHGGYLTPDKVEEALLDPDTVIRLATSLKEERAKRQELESRNALIAPKAGFYDAVMDDSRWFSVTEAARQMHQYDKRMNRSRLFALLRADRMMTADNQATKLAIDRGYLMNYQPPQQRNAKTGEVMVPKPYGKVTGKGLDWCIRRYCSEVR